jgi:trigger factor
MADEQKNLEAQTEQEETTLLKINIVSVEDMGTLKKKVTVEVPQDEVDQKLEENYKELTRSAAVPGFRIGRAPRGLVERRFSKEVRDQVRIQLIALAVDQSLEESKLNTLGEPDLDLDTIELPEKGALTFSYEVEVQPEFDLPALEGVEVAENEAEVTDKDIDEQVENYRWQLASLQDVAEGGATEKNDHIEADMVFEVNDEPPVVKHDSPIDLRPVPFEGVMFEELGDLLAGLKIGESKTVEAKVADTHENEAWRGKTAKLAVTVKKIFRWERPEINEELAKKFGYDNVETLREAMKTQLEAQKGQQVRRDMEDQVRKYLLGNVTIDVPEGLAERQTNSVLYRRMLELQQYGIPPVLIEQKLDDLRTKARDQAVDDLKLSFIFGKVARQYEIETSEEEINGVIASLAAQSGRRPERVREEMMRDGTVENVKDMIRERKVLEKMLDKAKIVKGQSK